MKTFYWPYRTSIQVHANKNGAIYRVPWESMVKKKKT